MLVLDCVRVTTRSTKQYFGEIKNEAFFKERDFLERSRMRKLT